MNLLTWNVRGLNKIYKQKEFKSFIRNNNVVLISILEHRVKEENAKKITEKFNRGWN